MKRIIYIAFAFMAITACHKGDPQPDPTRTPTITPFKTIGNDFWPGSSVSKTDPASGNVWVLMHRATGEREQVPYIQCFDSNMNSLSKGWVSLTSEICHSSTSHREFTILDNGNALCVYCDKRVSETLELPYYTIVTPDGTLLNPKGTLVYDTRDESYGALVETEAVSDGKGGAWVAICQGGLLVIRHISKSGEMSEPVKLKAQKEKEVYHGLKLMLAQDGGAFLTFLDMTHVPGVMTADYTGHTTLLKISADVRLEFEKQLNPEELCNAGGVPHLWPDAKGGAYLTRRGTDAKTGTELVYYSHFDRNGTVDKAFEENYKICIATKNYVGYACAVVPGSNTLCTAHCEFIKSEEQQVIGYTSLLTNVDENGEFIFKDKEFKGFDGTANPSDFVMAARGNNIVDIFYLSLENGASTYKASLGCIDTSDMSVNPTVTSITSSLTKSDLFWLPDIEKAYVNGKMNIVLCSTKSIVATQVVK